MAIDNGTHINPNFGPWWPDGNNTTPPNKAIIVFQKSTKNIIAHELVEYEKEHWQPGHPFPVPKNIKFDLINGKSRISSNEFQEISNTIKIHYETIPPANIVKYQASLVANEFSEFAPHELPALQQPSYTLGSNGHIDIFNPNPVTIMAYCYQSGDILWDNGHWDVSIPPHTTKGIDGLPQNKDYDLEISSISNSYIYKNTELVHFRINAELPPTV